MNESKGYQPKDTGKKMKSPPGYKKKKKKSDEMAIVIVTGVIAGLEMSERSIMDKAEIALETIEAAGFIIVKK